MKSRMAVMALAGGLVAWSGCGDPQVIPVMPPGVPQPKVPPPTAGGPAEAIGEGRNVAGAGTRVISKTISPPTPIGEPKTSSTSLVYETLRAGTGPACKPGDKIKVNYLGRLQSNGTKFDASADHGGAFPVTIGVGQVVPGWDEGIPGMKVGESRRLTVPPLLGYGSNGFPPAIPANATLVFDVDLLEITQSAPEPPAEKAAPPAKDAKAEPAKDAKPAAPSALKAVPPPK